MLLHAIHTRSWKASWKWNGEGTTFLEDPLAVNFFVFIDLLFLYVKYQRKSQLNLFRNQISCCYITETYQKQRALGLLCLGHRNFKEVFMIFLEVWLPPPSSLWFCPPEGKQSTSSGLILTAGAHVFQLFMQRLCVGYDQIESHVDHSYSESFWTGFRIQDSTCKNIFGV